MSKRALMLTAATAALLSGPVLGDDFTDIKTKVTQQIKTSTADNGAPGNILIESTGSVVVATAGPAVEIDSANTVTNQGTISNTGTDNAIGVQLDATGAGNGPGAGVVALDSSGTIDLTGSGTTKTGIFVGIPSGDTADTTGIFNGGINLETGSTLKATGDNTNALAIGANTTLNGAISMGGTVTLSGGTGMTGVLIGTADAPASLNGDLTLVLGSVTSVTGDSSFGINIEPNSTVTGNVEVDGALSVAPTTATSVTGGSVTGIMVGSNSTGNAIGGNFTVGTGASVSATGENARGVVLFGGLGGSFTNDGSIEAVGAAAPTSTSGNPTALNAIAIAGNIGGGFLNNGPVNAVDTTTSALIEGNGSAPVLLISPAAGGATASGNVEIAAANPLLPEGDFGIINRGQILASPGNVDQLNAVALQLEGAGTFTTDVEGGIFSSGRIAASTSGDDKQTGLMFATGLYIRSGADVPMFENSNQNSAAPGVISAQFSGAAAIGGGAVAIHVEQGGTLNQIVNQGTIAASATNSLTTISSLAARAIWDESGTLTDVENSGTISATATTLDNNSQVAVAIDMGSATQNTHIDNSGTITGAVVLGDAGDQVLVHGDVNQAASITGNIFFGGTSAPSSADDRLEIDDHASVIGEVTERPGGLLDVLINTGGSLTLTNNSIDINNRLFVNNLAVGAGGTLGLTLSQTYNIAGNPNAGGIVTSTGPVMLNPQALLNLSFGGFLSGQTPGEPSQFILIDAPLGQLQLDLPALQSQVCSNVPFLFASSDQQCLTTNPVTPDRSQLVLNLTPKTAADIGLTGYAAKMFPLANLALANDAQLGAAIIQAGVPINGVPLTQAQGQTLYESIYSQFAPNVTGASRALAVALTDESTGPVGARQRALRMYAGQPGDTTLWGQEFNFSLNEEANANTIGYRDTGFGFALGLDGGDPADGRYGGALTFYSGNINEKQPRTSRTTSEWALLTGYTDWRGRGFFLDTQLSAGVGSLDGKRSLTLDIPQPDGTTTTLSRVAEGKRATLLGALGAATGVILTTGSTVFTPMLSVDGLAMREEGYTEHGGGDPSGGDAFDLSVSPAYYSSLRGFLGADVRQDVNLGDFYLQPEARAGYRYDFLSNPEKLKASFASTPGTNFTLTGPDPSQGNIVLGGSLASTTGAWSIGVNYDYLRGNNGSISQEGTLTLVGRI